jgi:hypothetical protein
MAQQQEREVWYEPHPVTPARKKELVAAGYRIVDARYAPPGWVRPGWVSPKREIDNEPAEVATTPEGAKALEAFAAFDADPANYEPGVLVPTSAELRATLDDAGVEYPKHAPKAKLLELVRELNGA